MHLVKKREYSYDQFPSKWKEIVWFGNLEEINAILRDLEAIKKVIYINFNELSDKQFYDLISKFYSIYLSNEDILNIISQANNIVYDKFSKLNTKMVYKKIINDDTGFCKKTFKVSFIVATAKGVDLTSKDYSRFEIEQMIKNKQIISLGKIGKQIVPKPNISYEQLKELNIPEIKLDYERYNYIFSEVSYFDMIKEGNTEFSKKAYKIAVSMLRKELNNKKVLNDCKQILLFINQNINELKKVVYDENDKYIELVKKVNNENQKLLKFISKV